MAVTNIRKAQHAGSWYSDSTHELSRQLNYWLELVEEDHSPARAIIAPHAGYHYSGACGAYAFKQINPQLVKRIFILGPSHRVRLSGCALTTTEKYATPLYDLTIDLQINRELESSGEFEWMDIDTDRNEHSIEMQLPFIAKIMENYRNQFTIVPVLVGSLSPDRESLYGQIFSNYLKNPNHLFVISSDFCHWGQRFNYTYYEPNHGHIHQSIKELDRIGMDIIENINVIDFIDYIKKYKNTICGRHPIGILLNSIVDMFKNDQTITGQLRFLKYTQSNQCKSMNDSSVSYAAASFVVK